MVYSDCFWLGIDEFIVFFEGCIWVNYYFVVFIVELDVFELNDSISVVDMLWFFIIYGLYCVFGVNLLNKYMVWFEMFLDVVFEFVSDMYYGFNFDGFI